MLVTESQQIGNARPPLSSQTMKLLWHFVSKIRCTRFPSAMIILDDGLVNNLSSDNSWIKRAVAQTLPNDSLDFELETFLELQFQGSPSDSLAASGIPGFIFAPFGFIQ
jgi:hypothetical protein